MGNKNDFLKLRRLILRKVQYIHIDILHLCQHNIYLNFHIRNLLNEKIILFPMGLNIFYQL
jgi:hypothetical protein